MFLISQDFNIFNTFEYSNIRKFEGNNISMIIFLALSCQCLHDIMQKDFLKTSFESYIINILF